MAGTYFGLLALGVALMLPLAAVGVGIGEGMVFAAAIQGIARQPEAEGRIRNHHVCDLRSGRNPVHLHSGLLLRPEGSAAVARTRSRRCWAPTKHVGDDSDYELFTPTRHHAGPAAHADRRVF